MLQGLVQPDAAAAPRGQRLDGVEATCARGHGKDVHSEAQGCSRLASFLIEGAGV